MRPAMLALLFAFAPGAGVALFAADPPSARFARVEIASTWTSIYIGTVSLKMPALVRAASGDYASGYTARVFPLFFYNETGRISIRVPDADLQKLERGEAIEFTGRAVNQAGEERRIAGKATPASATSGKIKVRVFVSDDIELIFNTTYRFAGP